VAGGVDKSGGAGDVEPGGIVAVEVADRDDAVRRTGGSWGNDGEQPRERDER
jgi:hypothetical protein